MSEKRELKNPQPFDHPPTPDDVKELPNHGLYYSTEYLMFIEDSVDLRKCSTEELSKYSDYIIRGSLEQQWFKDTMLVTPLRVMKNPQHKFQLNIRAIGGIAYISLNSKDNKFKSDAESILTNWRTKY